jgi:hypothetical protein
MIAAMNPHIIVPTAEFNSVDRSLQAAKYILAIFFLSFSNFSGFDRSIKGRYVPKIRKDKNMLIVQNIQGATANGINQNVFGDPKSDQSPDFS